MIILHFSLFADYKMLAVTVEKPAFGIADAIHALVDKIRPLSEIPAKKGIFARLFRKRVAKRP